MSKISAKPIDISSLIGKCRNRIYRIGVELEGGWAKLPEGTSRLVGDGSVRFENPMPDELRTHPVNRGLATSTRQAREFQELYAAWANGDAGRSVPKHVGELPFGPIEVKELGQYMRQLYPSHVNDTCGMHVHMSFRKAFLYQRLMDERYPATIIDAVEKWAKRESLPDDNPIWDRLQGNNSYCKHEFYPDSQAACKNKNHHREGSRYTSINYCYGLHETIECRLLPMMPDAEMGIKAVQEVINITNAYLVAAGRREGPVVDAMIIQEDHYTEEMRECV